MAASDPATGVATPTGVLQGCAAFSYSGGTWAPAGAGPSVATPTGVLKGIAPFTYSGGWTPTGLAVPDVATPTGVLDGVAVYTWGGSSWAPPSGSSTPTGALRGVAGFQWDGSAWQPAGQAGPSVPTPFGVLDGVALFNWSGSAWVAASAGPPGVTLDLSFMGGTLPTGVTFARTGTATYFDSTGTMQTAAANAPRFDYNPSTRALNGLLIEESRTNIAQNSANLAVAPWQPVGLTSTAPVVTANAAVAPDGTTTATRVAYPTVSAGTSTINNNLTVTANIYTYSVWAKGVVGGERIWICMTPDGVAYHGRTAMVLTTSWQRFAVTSSVALAAGTEVMLIGVDLRDNPAQTAQPAQSVYLWGGQAEQGAFPTSYIPTTSAAVTRNAEFATFASGAWRHATAESYAVDYMLVTAQESFPRIVGSYTDVIGPIYHVGSSNVAGTYDGVVALNTVNAITLGAVSKAASTWSSPGNATLCLNGGAVASAATLTTGFAAISTFRLMGDMANQDQANGYIRRVRYWPRVLSNTEMQQVTT